MNLYAKYLASRAICICLVVGIAIMLSIENLNAQTNSVTSLIGAIKNADNATVKALLTNGADPNSIDEDGDHALMIAAFYADSECLEALLKKGADPNKTNSSGETALMWAAHSLEKTNLLIRYGANVNIIAKSGNNALMIAAIGSPAFDIVSTLLQHGADGSVVNAFGETALMRAARTADTATIRLLVGHTGNLDQRDAIGATALTTAVALENWPVAIQLLEMGANPDFALVFGLTSLNLASVSGHIQTVEAILKKTKNINAINSDGHSALMWAVYNEHDNPSLVQLLLDHGARINFRAKDGSTALSWARKKGNTATVALLIKNGAKD